MGRWNWHLLAAAGVIGGMGCSDTQAPAGPPPQDSFRPTIGDVIDVSNFGDGRDVQVTFSWPGSENAVSGYQLFVVPVAAGLTEPPTSAQFVTVAASPSPVTVAGVMLREHTGAALVQGEPYHVFVRADVGGLPSSFSAASAPITLARTDLIRTIAFADAGTGGMEVGADGAVYMGDFGPQLSGGAQGTQVLRITPEGQVSVFARGLLSASGNALNSDGDLLQANIGGDIVSKITTDGTVTTFATEGFSSPVGIAVGPGDTAYVANCGDNTIQRVDPDGSTQRHSSSSLLNCPNGIALASDGNLYVSNFFDGNLLRVTPGGGASVHTAFPTNNLGHTTFSNGVLYVAVRGTHQIAEVGLDGAMRILAGSGSRGGRDGAALGASLSFPNDIAVSADGSTLYFNDVNPATAGPNNVSPSVIRSLTLESGN